MSRLDGGSLLGSRGGALRGRGMVGAAVYQNKWRQALIGVERDLPPYVCGGHAGDTCDRRLSERAFRWARGLPIISLPSQERG